jgi:hypothetical protein
MSKIRSQMRKKKGECINFLCITELLQDTLKCLFPDGYIIESSCCVKANLKTDKKTNINNPNTVKRAIFHKQKYRWYLQVDVMKENIYACIISNQR